MIGLVFVLIIAAFILTPLGLIIAGSIMLLGSDQQRAKKGKVYLIAGILIVLVEFLIGYSICSGLK
ncbi:hypothetical protein [Ferruginibacter albus]|uniref:hypothetical protein n=1 Tax=Ferruginibacter albus TaxID=2875540 RepID=UPI001CC6B3B9|nr:hypothetical protein [Ferruginibacter albus]UAY51804.1 hypothetical protein K9M53_14575 [Ferruginibacter albus]